MQVILDLHLIINKPLSSWTTGCLKAKRAEKTPSTPGQYSDLLKHIFLSYLGININHPGLDLDARRT